MLQSYGSVGVVLEYERWTSVWIYWASTIPATLRVAVWGPLFYSFESYAGFRCVCHCIVSETKTSNAVLGTFLQAAWRMSHARHLQPALLSRCVG